MFKNEKNTKGGSRAKTLQLLSFLRVKHSFDGSEQEQVSRRSRDGSSAHSSSLSRVASGGELEKRMGLLSDVEKAMSRPWPVRAA